MKKKIMAIAAILAICMAGFAGCIRVVYDEPEAEQTAEPVPSALPEKLEDLGMQGFTANVQPYTVAADLSNVANLVQFGSFTPEQMQLLSQNGFVVAPSSEKQLFYIYEQNEYLKLPSFITTDSVLQVYHIFYDYCLRYLEQESLYGVLSELSANMMVKSIEVYNSISDSAAKELALRNIAYFGVALNALGIQLPLDTPQEAVNLAEAEYRKIAAQSGNEESPIFGFLLDYSQYKPRGHYTRTPELEKYFVAMMWYGQAPFNLFSFDGQGNPVREEEQTAKALLMTHILFRGNGGATPDIDLWDSIYDTTSFYVGDADDLTPYDIKGILDAVYGEDPELDSLLNAEKMDAVYEMAEGLAGPQIEANLTQVNTPTGKQFRFMGQRYIPDSEIMQKLVDSNLRQFPMGLDVMGVLGSDRAYDIITNTYGVQQQWPKYDENFKALQTKFSALPNETWGSNMYYGWMWTLKSLIQPFGAGYPSFMTNEAWQDKSLNTALASWAELRHDTILYGKQSGAECGDGMEMPVVKSYVEPNVEAYQKLQWLTQYSRENLTEMGILPEELEYRMIYFEDLLNFLATCSIKELNNEELNEEEYDALYIYGGTLENLTISFGEGDLLSEADENMAVVADVHTVLNNYLEVAVGDAAQIFVVVPIGGELLLTRGAVFSYYEFVHDSRLTDEEWQQLIDSGTEPAQPEWTQSYRSGEKEEIPVPKEPYSSGC